MIEKLKLEKKKEKKAEEERKTRIRAVKFNQQKTDDHREKIIMQVKKDRQMFEVDLRHQQNEVKEKDEIARNTAIEK